jgi:hypothetical protein
MPVPELPDLKQSPPSGPTARAPSAQPNGLGCNRSIPSSAPQRGAITDVAAMSDADSARVPRHVQKIPYSSCVGQMDETPGPQGFEEPETLTLAPLPCLEHLSPEQYRARSGVWSSRLKPRPRLSGSGVASSLLGARRSCSKTQRRRSSTRRNLRPRAFMPSAPWFVGISIVSTPNSSPPSGPRRRS